MTRNPGGRVGVCGWWCVDEPATMSRGQKDGRLTLLIIQEGHIRRPPPHLANTNRPTYQPTYLSTNNSLARTRIEFSHRCRVASCRDELLRVESAATRTKLTTPRHRESAISLPPLFRLLVPDDRTHTPRSPSPPSLRSAHLVCLELLQRPARAHAHYLRHGGQLSCYLAYVDGNLFRLGLSVSLSAAQLTNTTTGTRPYLNRLAPSSLRAPGSPPEQHTSLTCRSLRRAKRFAHHGDLTVPSLPPGYVPVLDG